MLLGGLLARSSSYTMLSQDHLLSVVIGRTLGTFKLIHNTITGPQTVCCYWEDSWHIQAHTQYYHRTTNCVLLGGLLEHGTFNRIHNAITGPLTVCCYWEDSWHVQAHTQCYHRTTNCVLLGGLLARSISYTILSHDH